MPDKPEVLVLPDEVYDAILNQRLNRLYNSAAACTELIRALYGTRFMNPSGEQFNFRQAKERLSGKLTITHGFDVDCVALRKAIQEGSVVRQSVARSLAGKSV